MLALVRWKLQHCTMATTQEEKDTYATHAESENGRAYSPSSPIDDFEADEEKKLMRKIDWRLLPILGALYSIALIDRVNVSIHDRSWVEQDICLRPISNNDMARSPTLVSLAWV